MSDNKNHFIENPIDKFNLEDLNKNYFTIFYKDFKIESLSRFEFENKLIEFDKKTEVTTDRHYKFMTHKEFIKFVKNVYKESLQIEDIVCSLPNDKSMIENKFDLIINIFIEILRSLPIEKQYKINSFISWVYRIKSEVLKSLK